MRLTRKFLERVTIDSVNAQLRTGELTIAAQSTRNQESRTDQPLVTAAVRPRVEEMTTMAGWESAAAGIVSEIAPGRVIAMVQGGAALATEKAPTHGQEPSLVAEVQGQATEMLKGARIVPPAEGRTVQAAHNQTSEEIAESGANLVRLPVDGRTLIRKTKVAAQTSIPVRHVTTAQLRGTATNPAKAEGIAEDSVDSRAAVIAQQRSLTGAIPAHSRAAIVAAGSASLPVVDDRMTVPRHAEATMAAALRSS